MKIISTRTRIALFAGAIVLLLQVSPALASGPVAVTFTKWFSAGTDMTGFTGGDVPGIFVGEVLQRQVSHNAHVGRLEAVYEVQAEDPEHSFSALIRGGSSFENFAALDGRILAGWRKGAQVHVEFTSMTDCEGAPPGVACFVGTIYVEQAPGQ